MGAIGDKKANVAIFFNIQQNFGNDRIENSYSQQINVVEMIVSISDRKHCEERIKYWLLAFKSSVFLGLLKPEIV